jgi:hypothetical protein
MVAYQQSNYDRLASILSNSNVRSLLSDTNALDIPSRYLELVAAGKVQPNIDADWSEINLRYEIDKVLTGYGSEIISHAHLAEVSNGNYTVQSSVGNRGDELLGIDGRLIYPTGPRYIQVKTGDIISEPGFNYIKLQYDWFDEGGKLRALYDANVHRIVIVGMHTRTLFMGDYTSMGRWYNRISTGKVNNTNLNITEYLAARNNDAFKSLANVSHLF